MRGKRGQEVVLRELFSFALGVIIMFLIIVMFNLILAPQIKEFSVNEQAYSMIYHFNSIFENAHESITNLNTDSLALSYELPSDVGGQSYRVFVDAGELCVRTRGDVAILRCTPLNTHATVAGSYLSGTDLSLIVSEQNGEIKVNFNNVAVKYEAYIYYPSCGSLPVVNLNNSATYSADDSFICSCNTKVLENQLYNPSFDEGLNYWYIYTSHPSHLYSFNSSNYITDPSLFMQSAYPDPGYHFYPYQAIPTVNNVTMNFYGTNFSTSFAGLMIIYNTTNLLTRTINMVFGGANLLSYCNSHQGSIYINCLTTANPEDFVWGSISVNPIEDGFKYHGLESTDYSNILVGPIIAGATWLSVDDLSAETNSNSLYCDKNNDGYADGVCYNNICSNTYLGFNIGETQFFTNEYPTITNDFINYNTSATCNLNINSIDYDMDIYQNFISKTIPVTLSRGNYNANITCISDNIFSKSYSITSSLLKVKNSFTNFTSINERDFYHTVGEINPSYPGKELFLIVRDSNLFSDAEHVQIYSSESEFVSLIPPSTGSSVINGLAVIDINNDGFNEVLIKDDRQLRMFDHLLSEVWSYNLVSNSANGLTIGEINNSFLGLEILFHLGNDLYVLNSSGNLLWTFNAPITGYDSGSPTNPVVGDINIDNPGLEILFPSPNNALYMFDTLGNTLYSYPTPNTDYIITPSIADINNTSDGLEIAYINRSNDDTNMNLILLNSTLNQLWNYTFFKGIYPDSYPTKSNYPQSVAIGDVNGNGDKEVVFMITNFTEDSENGDEFLNDYLIILSKNGDLITNHITNTRWLQIGLSLAEIDNQNPGLEIVTARAHNFQVLDYQGNELHSDTVGYVAGQIFIIEDIDGDGNIELINADNNEAVRIRDGQTSSINNNWITFNHDYNRTGYQD